MSRQVLSREELSENQRWEDRYADPLKFDVAIGSDKIQIGDEIFSVKDLEKSHAQHPQPASHPFKPHHYLVQEALDDLKAFYTKFPDRKAR